MANQAPDPSRVVTSSHRIVYAHFAGKDRKQDDGTIKKKYEVTLLIPKGHPDVARIQAAEKAAYDREAQGKFKGIPFHTDRIKKKLQDGDKYMSEGREDQTFYEGMMFLSLSSNEPFALFDQYGVETTAASIKSGDYGRAVIKSWPYDTNSKGVTFFIDSFKKTADGEPLAVGSTASAADYDDEEDYSGSGSPAPSPVPPRPTAPAAPSAPSGPPRTAAPAAPPRPVAPAPAPVQPEPIWDKTAEGHDIYSYDGGVNWHYAE